MSEYPMFELEKVVAGCEGFKDFYKTSSCLDASAGTGKTYTIENLVANLLVADENRLIGNKPVSLSEILVVTFTKKAAGELQSRIAKAIREMSAERPCDALKKALNEINQAPIYTIDAFCNQVLTEYCFEANFAAGASVSSDDSMIRDIVRRDCLDHWKDEEDFCQLLEEKDAEKLIKSVVELTKNYTEGDVETLQVDKEKDPLSYFCHEKAKHAYKLWQKKKLETLQLSFTDLKIRVRKAFATKDSKLLKLLREKFRYGIIDEFQDTDPAQWDIFGKIFLKEEGDKFTQDENHVIYVVGDPKQSIYSFRGGNVEVYKSAVKDVPGKYRLGHNQRSSQAMIEACNVISEKLMKNIDEPFSESEMGDCDAREKFFFAKENGVKLKGDFNEEKKAPFRIFSYSEPIVTENGKKKTKPGFEKRVEKKYYDWVARQILDFKISDNFATIEIPVDDRKDKGYRFINYSDITILGRTKSELNAVARVLKKVNIPCSRYKDESLFEGVPATHWSALLKGVACINSRKNSDVTAIRAALLTDFFDVDLATLQSTEDYEENKTDSVGIAIGVMKKLNESAKKKEWGNLVERALRKTDLEKRLAERGDLENLSKFRQVADYIVDYLYSENADLLKMSRHLLQVRDQKRKPVGEGQEFIGKDSEIPQVKLMTIHASKGLQAPVVIVVGGIRLGHSQNDVISAYNCVEDCKKLVRREVSLASAKFEEKFKLKNLNGGSNETLISGPKDLAHYQIEEEWHNLFYVAYTRAKFLCYAPECHSYPQSDDPEEIKVVKKNFLNRLLCDVMEKANSNFYVFKADEKTEIKLPVFEPSQKKNDSTVTFDNICDELKAKQDAIAASLNSTGELLQKDFILSTQSSSYSALSKTNASDKSSEDDEPKYEETSEDLKILQFPSNNKIGSALHRMFELIDYQAGRDMYNDVSAEDLQDAIDNEDVLKRIFNDLKDKSVRDLVISSLRINGASDKYAPHCALIVYHTLNALIKLPLVDEPMRLGDLLAKDRRHEMNFDMNTVLVNTKNIKFAEENSGDDKSGLMFNGSIDLLFRYTYKGVTRWYILDWKSNRLPEKVPYSAKNIEENIIADVYDLQRALYSKVFIEWYTKLSNKTEKKDVATVYDESFGGVIYCYLRGCKKGSDEGFNIFRWNSYEDLKTSLAQSVESRYSRLAQGKKNAKQNAKAAATTEGEDDE